MRCSCLLPYPHNPLHSYFRKVINHNEVTKHFLTAIHEHLELTKTTPPIPEYKEHPPPHLSSTKRLYCYCLTPQTSGTPMTSSASVFSRSCYVFSIDLLFLSPENKLKCVSLLMLIQMMKIIIKELRRQGRPLITLCTRCKWRRMHLGIL
jgi:hypothetical protein